MSFKALGQFENIKTVQKLNFLLYLAWTILKDFVSCYVFTKKIFCSISQNMISLYLIKYVKMVSISQKVSEKRTRIKLAVKIYKPTVSFQQSRSTHMHTHTHTHTHTLSLFLSLSLSLSLYIYMYILQSKFQEKSSVNVRQRTYWSTSDYFLNSSYLLISEVSKVKIH